jgi:hypothetical protein
MYASNVCYIDDVIGILMGLFCVILSVNIARCGLH